MSASSSIGAPNSPPSVRFDQNGLISAVIQDADSDAVLMVGFMNDEALAATRRTGRTHFWSRSRGKLWRKGETSGHEQIVEEILINCERNSVLIKVRQIGAVCHDGYATCYYRRFEDDDTLTTIRERVFDPAQVYGSDDTGDLPALTRLWLGAYQFLRDHDLERVSGTSARLRADHADATPRIADELRELAGVLDGTHGHDALQADIVLEGSQVLYWAAVASLRAGCMWDDLRPDRALATSDESLAQHSAARLLRAEADRWSDADQDTAPAHYHALIALVAQACRSAGIDPAAVIEADLADLRTKPYLADYFAGTAGAGSE